MSDPCDRTMDYIVERVTLVFYVHVSPNGQYVRLGRANVQTCSQKRTDQTSEYMLYISIWSICKLTRRREREKRRYRNATEL